MKLDRWMHVVFGFQVYMAFLIGPDIGIAALLGLLVAHQTFARLEWQLVGLGAALPYVIFSAPPLAGAF